MTRRQIRENLYKMLFQVEFHDKESLRTQIEIYLEDLEMADEKDKSYTYQQHEKFIWINSMNLLKI